MHFVDLDGDGVRELVAKTAQRLLTDQLGDTRLHILVGGVVLRVETRAFRQVVDENVQQRVRLHTCGCGDRHDLAVGAEHVVQFEQALADGVLVGLVQFGHNAHDRRVRLRFADLVEDEAVAGADLLVRRHGKADHVDVRERVLDNVVEALAQQRARAVNPRRVHHNDLRAVAVDHAADRVARGFRLVGHDGDLLPHQRVGQRGLAGVRPADEADKARLEPFRRVCETAVSDRVFWQVVREINHGAHPTVVDNFS